jgi:hypothetical protein
MVLLLPPFNSKMNLLLSLLHDIVQGIIQIADKHQPLAYFMYSQQTLMNSTVAAYFLPSKPFYYVPFQYLQLLFEKFSS